MTYETYRNIFMIAGILCGIMFVVSVVLYIVFKVPKLIGDLSGSTARKAIQDIREKNEVSGDKTYRISGVNRSRSKLTDKISYSGKIYPSKQEPLGTGVVTEKIATQSFAPQNAVQISEETTLLSTEMNQGMTSQLSAGETTLLMPEMDFEIEFEITYIHTEEKVS